MLGPSLCLRIAHHLTASYLLRGSLCSLPCTVPVYLLPFVLLSLHSRCFFDTLHCIREHNALCVGGGSAGWRGAREKKVPTGIGPNGPGKRPRRRGELRFPHVLHGGAARLSGSLVPWSSRFHEASHEVGRRRRASLHVELLVDAGKVILHRLLFQPQDLADLLVRLPLGQELPDPLLLR